MCQDDKSALEQIKASFVIAPNIGLIKRRPKQQFVIVSVLITSLITNFSTKEFIAMSSGDSTDELYDSTNHIISAIEDHEIRIVRLEYHQKQLEHHIKELTATLVMGIKQSDIFYNAFAVSNYALRLSTHIKEIRIGLYTIIGYILIWFHGTS